jgi:hypothetical protein
LVAAYRSVVARAVLFIGGGRFDRQAAFGLVSVLRRAAARPSFAFFDLAG